mmetsp:Transcript_31571/g.75043  ORF Transcript_31571/g.75043 Transcript_31571/m.75043 type:complete len:237 (+) Transcript_31571:564-1274(+)
MPVYRQHSRPQAAAAQPQVAPAQGRGGVPWPLPRGRPAPRRRRARRELRGGAPGGARHRLCAGGGGLREPAPARRGCRLHRPRRRSPRRGGRRPADLRPDVHPGLHVHAAGQACEGGAAEGRGGERLPRGWPQAPENAAGEGQGGKGRQSPVPPPACGRPYRGRQVSARGTALCRGGGACAPGEGLGQEEEAAPCACKAGGAASPKRRCRRLRPGGGNRVPRRAALASGRQSGSLR